MLNFCCTKSQFTVVENITRFFGEYCTFTTVPDESAQIGFFRQLSKIAINREKIIGGVSGKLV